jgi:hypothetical protein
VRARAQLWCVKATTRTACTHDRIVLNNGCSATLCQNMFHDKLLAYRDFRPRASPPPAAAAEPEPVPLHHPTRVVRSFVPLPPHNVSSHRSTRRWS